MAPSHWMGTLQKGDGLGFEGAAGQTIVSSSSTSDLLLFELQ